MVSNSNLIFFLFLTFILSVWVTGFVRQSALAANLVDKGGEDSRKRHKKAVPLAGGIAVFLSFFGVVFFLWFRGLLPNGYVHLRELSALFLGGAVLIAGGILDDKFTLKPGKQILFPILAAGFAVIGGIHFTEIKNPFGGMINLGIWNYELGIRNLELNFIFPADILSFLWLMGMIYTTKLLDGLDGLSAGTSAIAAIFIALLAMRPELNQPQTAIIAGILAAALLGFLVWNFHPAKIFLGEGGSTLVGFLAGGLSIAAGTKVATTLLVMGIPVLDIAAVILRRVRAGKPISEGGREHFHFRLIDAGVSHRGAVLFYYLFSLSFGGASWFLGTGAKAIAFILLLILFFVLVTYIERRRKKYESR